MSRRRRSEKREIIPDPKFGDVILSKFINVMMLDGKKSASESVVYRSLEIIASKKKMNPIEIFHDALGNVTPSLEVKSRRVGGATYQVPVPVMEGRGAVLAIRWLIQSARGRSETKMSERLAGEILDASDKRGNAVKKREDTHKMAEANRAFAHYRW